MENFIFCVVYIQVHWTSAFMKLPELLEIIINYVNISSFLFLNDKNLFLSPGGMLLRSHQSLWIML